MFDVKRCDLHLAAFPTSCQARKPARRSVAAAVLVASACSAPPATEEPSAGDMSTPGGAGAPAVMPNGAAPSEASPAQPSPNSMPSATTPEPEPLPMDVVLDDFEDGDGELSSAGFSGSWRTYSDGTGTVAPAVDTPVIPVDGAVQVSGSGFSIWGVGLSVDLNTSSGRRQPVDLSEHRGLKIRAKGVGTIEVELVTPGTTGAEEVGGTCAAPSACFGHYAAALALAAEYEEMTLPFSTFRQPEWATSTPLDLSQVLAINLLSRANDGPVGIELWVDAVSLAAPLAPSQGTTAESTGGTGVATVDDGSNPFAGRVLNSEGGAALGAYNAASGTDRELLAKVALNPAAFWLVGGDPGRAGGIVDGGGERYTVLVVYNIPNRDCSGASAGGAGSAAEYQGWIDGVARSLQGKEAAVILEPDALALSCGESTESLIAYAVNSLRQNAGIAVYIDGGHSNWVSPDAMAGRLRNAGIERATGFAVNVSNFQPTPALIGYGRNLSALLGGKPFVIDTSRNGRGARGAEWCNPAGAGLGEAPTAATGDDAVHALLWVKRPGESDGACGQCAETPAGQFCASYALELALNAVF
jgi:endoglucanase